MIEILRLGHRLPRDERISTHVALVARTFGANIITYSGQHDHGLEESVKRICERWGADTGEGEFKIAYEPSSISFIKKRKKDGFTIVHLTMYGIQIQNVSSEIRKKKKMLIIVGSEAVPAEVYQLADFNIAVTNQPHSEVAALAITLDRIMNGSELETKDFKGKIFVEPSEKGKKVLTKSL